MSSTAVWQHMHSHCSYNGISVVSISYAQLKKKSQSHVDPNIVFYIK